jgi:tripartite-type tricarboxylate transporter receptor subunit TctC
VIRLGRRAALLGAAALPLPALAQDFPSRPIRLVVPFPPGGGTDILARVLAQKLGEGLGQSVVVENRGGAGGAIGTQAVARARPDGHTLLFTSSPPVVVLPAMQPPPPYDAERELQPVATLAQQPILFVVPANSPHRDLGSLVRAAAGNGLSYGSPGVGTDPHLAAEVLAQVTGAIFTHVPYRGGGPAVTALLAGETDFNPALTGVARPLLAEGRIRALAITSASRSPDLPDVPTTTELGLPQVNLVPWWGLFAPAGLEAPADRRLQAEVQRLGQDADWLGRLRAQSIDPLFLDGPATASAVSAQLAGWRQRLPGIRLQ